MRYKKSQTAIEAALLIGFLLLMFTVFIIVMNMRLDSIYKEKNLLQLGEVGKIIKAEIDLAFMTEDGYERTFEVPIQIEGHDYNITLHNGSTLNADYSTLTLSYAKDAAVFGEKILFLPKNTNGTIGKGNTKIVKSQGIINLVYTCSNYCIENRYDSGTCRINWSLCRDNQEVNEPVGDVYCTGGQSADTCCCVDI